MADKKQKGQQAPVEDLNEMMKVRREKMEEFRAMGVPPFGHRYEVTDYAEPIKEKYAHLEGDEEGGEVRIAGRLMAIRGHGKASFCTLNDRTGNIQVYFKIDVLGEDKYKNQFKKLDIGDIVGIRGIVFKTHRGEVTVRVEDFDLLSKSLRPLPEKFHGLQDVDIRYRQRYLDLIMNPEVRDTFRKRTKIIQSIRTYLDDRDYLEVETPVLSTIAGGAARARSSRTTMHSTSTSTCASRRSSTSSASSSAVSTASTRWAASSATRAWMSATTRSSRRSSSTRRTLTTRT